MSSSNDENFCDCNNLTMSEIDQYIASDSELEDCNSSGDSWKPPCGSGSESDPAFNYDNRETDCNSSQLSTNHSLVSLSDNIDSSTSTPTQLLTSSNLIELSTRVSEPQISMLDGPNIQLQLPTSGPEAPGSLPQLQMLVTEPSQSLSITHPQPPTAAPSQHNQPQQRVLCKCLNWKYIGRTHPMYKNNFGQYMSRDHFFLILRCFHLTQDQDDSPDRLRCAQTELIFQLMVVKKSLKKSETIAKHYNGIVVAQQIVLGSSEHIMIAPQLVAASPPAAVAQPVPFAAPTPAPAPVAAPAAATAPAPAYGVTSIPQWQQPPPTSQPAWIHTSALTSPKPEIKQPTSVVPGSWMASTSAPPAFISSLTQSAFSSASPAFNITSSTPAPVSLSVPAVPAFSVLPTSAPTAAPGITPAASPVSQTPFSFASLQASDSYGKPGAFVSSSVPTAAPLTPVSTVPVTPPSAKVDSTVVPSPVPSSPVSRPSTPEQEQTEESQELKAMNDALMEEAMKEEISHLNQELFHLSQRVRNINLNVSTPILFYRR
ncbi:hypothetical protein J6590_076652 [Homalodisca vitripennis]|nr:hypothetical protein J6590_076652 [Homalodisca vitripennis]